jgi:hypothetical protein
MEQNKSVLAFSTIRLVEDMVLDNGELHLKHLLHYFITAHHRNSGNSLICLINFSCIIE